MSDVVHQPHWPNGDEAANIERDGKMERVVTIAKLAAGTTLTQAMMDEMLRAYIAGEPVRTWFDGESVRVEAVSAEDFYLPAPKAT